LFIAKINRKLLLGINNSRGYYMTTGKAYTWYLKKEKMWLTWFYLILSAEREMDKI
jgi:hypothetical protein